MPQKSSFFDSTADDPRYYPAREFAEYFSRFVGNGVYTGGMKLKVDASGSDANVTISPGFGWINGYLYSVYDAPLVMPVVPATTQDRIDRIILRLDTSAPVRAIRAVVLQGIPAANPAAPQIVRAGDIYDLSLAQVRVKANTSTVKPENITDERLNNSVCGVVTGLVQQADTTAIFNQFQAWLNTSTANYSKQWDDFLKSVQDEGFATTQYVDSKASTAETNAKTYADGKASTAESNAKGYVDAKPWQKAKLTADNGICINVSNQNANNLTTNGFYVGENVANSPVPGAGQWWYIQVQTMASGVWVKQIAINLFSNTFQMRTGSDTGGAISWGPWTADLFTSVSDGKNAIAGAITGKGVPASGSDAFAVLASKIGQINTGKRYATGTTTSDSTYQKVVITGLAFTPSIVYLETASGASGLDSAGWAVVNKMAQYGMVSQPNGWYVKQVNSSFSSGLGTASEPLIFAGGFRSPGMYGNHQYKWVAFE